MNFNWLDWSTYFVNNSIGLVIGFFVGLLAALFTVLIVGDSKMSGWKQATACLSSGLSTWLVVSTLMLLPSHDKILAVKLSKIKNEAVTKENIDKGVEHIERVLKKLETKYLGE